MSSTLPASPVRAVLPCSHPHSLTSHMMQCMPLAAQHECTSGRERLVLRAEDIATSDLDDASQGTVATWRPVCSCGATQAASAVDTAKPLLVPATGDGFAHISARPVGAATHRSMTFGDHYASFEFDSATGGFVVAAVTRLAADPAGSGCFLVRANTRLCFLVCAPVAVAVVARALHVTRCAHACMCCRSVGFRYG